MRNTHPTSRRSFCRQAALATAGIGFAACLTPPRMQGADGGMRNPFCLRVGDESKIPELLEMARPHLFFVTINGADHTGDWDRLIEPLGQGAFDLASVLKVLKRLGYEGPIGLQHYGIKGDARKNLEQSMAGWKRLSALAG